MGVVSAEELDSPKWAASSREAIAEATVAWSPRDLALLAELVKLGPPTALHDGSCLPPAGVERGTDYAHGGAPYERRSSNETDRARTDLLLVYRRLSLLHLSTADRLPAPGKPEKGKS